MLGDSQSSFGGTTPKSATVKIGEFTSSNEGFDDTMERRISNLDGENIVVGNIDIDEEMLGELKQDNSYIERKLKSEEIEDSTPKEKGEKLTPEVNQKDDEEEIKELDQQNQTKL